MKTYKPQPFTFDRVVRLLITIGFAIGFLWLINYLSGVLVPFVIALLLAYIIHPLVDFFQYKIKFPRGLAIGASLFTIVGTFTLFSWILIPMINEEFISMGGILKHYFKDADAQQYIPENLTEEVQKWVSQTEVQAILNKADYSAIIKKVYPKLSEVFTGSVDFLVSLFSIVIILLYLIFILADYEKVMKGWKKLIPPHYRKKVVDLVHDFNVGMNQYFRAQALVAFIVGVLFAIGFEIIGLPLGIILGLFIGALNMVPYLQTFGLVPAALLGMLGLLIALPITTLIQAYYFRYIRRAEVLEQKIEREQIANQ